MNEESVFPEILSELRSSDPYDTILAEKASAELAALYKEINRLRELVLRAQNDMMSIESRCLTKNREKARSMEFVPILSIVSKWMTPLKGQYLCERCGYPESEHPNRRCAAFARL